MGHRNRKHRFKGSFNSDIKNDAKRETVVPEIQKERLKNHKKRMERKEWKLKLSNQKDQEEYKVRLSSIRNHEQLVERKDLELKPNDRANQEDKKIQDLKLK